jgi:putative transposase
MDGAGAKAGRSREASAEVIDCQTARATGPGGPERGFDAGKKTFGRKRHLLVDASGLVLLAHIRAASLH